MARTAPLNSRSCLVSALRSPQARITAIDVNRRALDLTRDNAARAGAANVEVFESDQVPADRVFADIYSNPPIKVGKDILHELLELWLPRLAPGGAAQTHAGLGLTRNLADRARLDARRLKSKSGYRILEVAGRYALGTIRDAKSPRGGCESTT